MASRVNDDDEHEGVRISVRCYAELNSYLPESARGREFDMTIKEEEKERPVTAGAVIRRLGIPEGEVDVVLRDGESVSLEDSVLEGQRLSVFPVIESFDVSELTRVRIRPLRSPRFLLDVHLGKLASFMRMMGYDALYQPGYNDDELVSISVHEARALLSKDRPLLGHTMLTRAYYVKSISPREQLLEVLRRFHLIGLARPFTRCLVCNTPLKNVGKEPLTERLPARVRDAFDEFYWCPFCDKIYWKGSHYERMQNFIGDVRRELAASDASDETPL